MSPPPAVQRETVGLVVVAILVRLLALVRLILLRLLPAGDEGRQSLDIAILAAALRLMLLMLRLAAAVGLLLPRGEELRIPRQVGLRVA